MREALGLSRRAAAFRTWRRFLDIQRRLERCLRRCLNRHLAKGLTKWTSHCHFTKRTRERQAVAFDMMERCIGRLLHRSMGEAFDTWLAAAEALSAAGRPPGAVGVLAEKCLRKRLRRLTSRAFRTWTAGVAAHFSPEARHAAGGPTVRVAVGPRGSCQGVPPLVRARLAAHDLRGRFHVIERIMMRALRRLVATARARAFAALREVATPEPSPRPPCHNAPSPSRNV